MRLGLSSWALCERTRAHSAAHASPRTARTPRAPEDALSTWTLTLGSCLFFARGGARLTTRYKYDNNKGRGSAPGGARRGVPCVGRGAGGCGPGCGCGVRVARVFASLRLRSRQVQLRPELQRTRYLTGSTTTRKGGCPTDWLQGLRLRINRANCDPILAMNTKKLSCVLENI
jgi:hypothetical protein